MSATLIVQKLSLKVPYRAAERRMAALMDRGERLKFRARRFAELGQGTRFVVDWNLWYNACLTALTDIYPTAHEADIVLHAQATAETWPMKVQQVIDVLADLKDTVRKFDQPPATVTIATWVSERPGVRLLVDGILIIFGAVVLGKAAEIAEWLKRLLP